MSEGKTDLLNRVYLFVGILGSLAAVLAFILGFFKAPGASALPQVTSSPTTPAPIESTGVHSGTSTLPGVAATATPASLTTNTPVPSSTPGQTALPPTATPSPVPSPAPEKVLYQADWSQGLAGWAPAGQWKTIKGRNLLLSDAGGGAKLTFAPIDLSDTPDYAVEAEIQTPEGGGCNRHFGLVARANPRADSTQGYMVGWVNMTCGNSGGLEIMRGIKVADPWNAEGIKNAYPEANYGWHTYRLEVDGNELRVFYDGQPVVSATDNRYLDGTSVGLWSSGAAVNVRSFRVIALR